MAPREAIGPSLQPTLDLCFCHSCLLWGTSIHRGIIHPSTLPRGHCVIHPSTCLFVHQLAPLTIHPLAHLQIYLSTSVQFVCLFISPSIYPPIHLFVHLVHQHILYSFTYNTLYPCTYNTSCPPTQNTFHPSAYNTLSFLQHILSYLQYLLSY